MTKAYHFGWFHLTRGRPRGWVLTLGRHAYSGGRLWFGWTPFKGEGHGWRWHHDGCWDWRRGAWEVGCDEWGLIPIVSGALLAVSGLGLFLWRVLG